MGMEVGGSSSVGILTFWILPGIACKIQNTQILTDGKKHMCDVRQYDEVPYPEPSALIASERIWFRWNDGFAFSIRRYIVRCQVARLLANSKRKIITAHRILQHYCNGIRSAKWNCSDSGWMHQNLIKWNTQRSPHATGFHFHIWKMTMQANECHGLRWLNSLMPKLTLKSCSSQNKWEKNWLWSLNEWMAMWECGVWGPESCNDESLQWCPLLYAAADWVWADRGG